MDFAPAAGAVAPSVIHTDTDNLDHGDFRLPVSDGTLAAYFARPQGAVNVPVVLVIQEIFGLHAHIKDVVRRVAKLGFFAVGINLYERQGDASTNTDIAALIKDIVAKVPDEQVLSDLDAGLAWAAAQGGDAQRIGVTGFCWGGRLTWMYAAHNPDVRAGVAWYGKVTQGHGPLITRNPIDVTDALKGPVLGLYGALDQSIPVSGLDTLRERLRLGSDAAKASEIVVYTDANHAFFADYRSSYRAGEAADGWAKLSAWFAKYLA